MHHHLLQNQQLLIQMFKIHRHLIKLHNHLDKWTQMPVLSYQEAQVEWDQVLVHLCQIIKDLLLLSNQLHHNSNRIFQTKDSFPNNTNNLFQDNKTISTTCINSNHLHNNNIIATIKEDTINQWVNLKIATMEECSTQDTNKLTTIISTIVDTISQTSINSRITIRRNTMHLMAANSKINKEIHLINGNLINQ